MAATGQQRNYGQAMITVSNSAEAAIHGMMRAAMW